MRAINLGIVAAALAHVVAKGPSNTNAAARWEVDNLRAARRHAMDKRTAGSESSVLHARQAGRCGPDYGDQVCDEGDCCSSAGWCGQGYLYCSAPSCQIEYGPACDANVRPNGPDTSDVSRSQVGSVPYGTPIYRCSRPGDIAITFDDGPFSYTEDLLDKLQAHDAKATFFVTGRNLGKGAINDPSTGWPSLLRRMIDEGHQIASHTWSHQRLTAVSESKFRNQMVYLEVALADLLGYFPTYMRPPYSACDATCESLLSELGYHIAYFNLDTEGYLRDSPEAIQGAKDIWDAAVEGADASSVSYLHIEHDPVYQTVYNLTDHMLESLADNGFRAVTVGECLRDPEENWYRRVEGSGGPPASTRSSSPSQTQSSTVSPPTGTLPPTTNGRCGPNHDYMTCAEEPLDATCCSWAAWCGSTKDHCGTGCQEGYGTCGS